jgi:hypothetical protein
VKALIDADVRPHLAKTLNHVEVLSLEVAQVMQALDEMAHHTTASLNAFATKIAG